MKSTEKYNDVIDLPRHVSPRHLPMPLEDRAAQFSAFAALTGFDGVIRETGRLTEGMIDLDEGGIALLDEKLQQIRAHLHTQPQVNITYFRPDARKKGGAYVSVAGKVVKIDLYKREVYLHCGTVIPIDRIYAIEEPA